MHTFPPGTAGQVIKDYQQPYPDPIRVRAGARVFPDPSRETDWPGWVWCTGEDGKGGWTPRAWLRQAGDDWHITRDYDALELTVRVGDAVTPEFAESSFVWVTTPDGRRGWMPESHLQLLPSPAGGR